MKKADIGLIGLGVMGANLALNIAEKGYHIAVYNRTMAKTHEFYEKAGELRDRIVPCETLVALTNSITTPRPILLMILAGDPVDQEINALRPLLMHNDIIIDAGNANFHDTIRRLNGLSANDPTFVGMGVSGGEDGARHGPSIMVGGTKEAYARISPILTSIAAKYESQACCALLGADGAGHFVKTIHNGIEYADMQMIAEIYGMLRDALGLSASAIGQIFAKWNEGPLRSYLIEITAKILQTIDPDTGKAAVDVILDSAGQKGTGCWSAIEAQMLGIPASTIEAAVTARSLSALKEERIATSKIYTPHSSTLKIEDHARFIDDLEQGLLAAKIIAYAQGFAIMSGASQKYDWELPLATIARIWRAGCIIRSQFLDVIAEAFDKDTPENLLLAPAFIEQMLKGAASLRHLVSQAIALGLPVPALASALTYFDNYRQMYGPANLIQAQRDFFGAHGFKRIDKEGDFHGPWSDIS